MPFVRSCVGHAKCAPPPPHALCALAIECKAGRYDRAAAPHMRADTRSGARSTAVAVRAAAWRRRSMAPMWHRLVGHPRSGLAFSIIRRVPWETRYSQSAPGGNQSRKAIAARYLPNASSGCWRCVCLPPCSPLLAGRAFLGAGGFLPVCHGVGR